MSDKNLARRTVVEITFDGVDITRSIRPYFKSLTYTDSEEEDADDLQIQLQDSGAIWVGQWLNDAIDAAASTDTRRAGTAYTITANRGLNVRAGPGIENKKLGALPKGTELIVSNIENGWATVDYNGTTAYVSASYIKETCTSSATDQNAKGLEIQAVIVRQNWHGDGVDDPLDCGIFELDRVDCSGPPAELTIRATALPFRSRVRQTKKSRGWESYFLDGIAREIAVKNGLVCMFLSTKNPFYERVEQYRTSDISFLQQLCQTAGCSLKAANKMLVIFDQAYYERKDSINTIRRGDGSYSTYKLSTSTADTQYQSCRVYYTAPASGKCIEATAYHEDYDRTGDSQDNQRLEICHKVSSVEEAKNLAEKYLRLHNKFEKTARFTGPGNPLYLAGVTVELQGWGGWDGKYIIRTAKHTVGPSGYTTTIDARRVLEGY